jgi:hypothetical protein
LGFWERFLPPPGAPVQVTSKELTRGNGWRIDMENRAPGQRPAQIHVQDYGGNTWQSDFDARRFIGLPKALEKEVAEGLPLD